MRIGPQIMSKPFLTRQLAGIGLQDRQLNDSGRATGQTKNGDKRTPRPIVTGLLLYGIQSVQTCVTYSVSPLIYRARDASGEEIRGI